MKKRILVIHWHNYMKSPNIFKSEIPLGPNEDAPTAVAIYQRTGGLWTGNCFIPWHSIEHIEVIEARNAR